MGILSGGLKRTRRIFATIGTQTTKAFLLGMYYQFLTIRIFMKFYDIKHSDDKQDRYNGFGYVEKSGLSVVQVAYTKHGCTHIISARPATSQERKMYYDRLKEIYGEM